MYVIGGQGDREAGTVYGAFKGRLHMSMKHCWCDWQGKRRYIRKCLTQRHFVPHKRHIGTSVPVSNTIRTNTGESQLMNTPRSLKYPCKPNLIFHDISLNLLTLICLVVRKRVVLCSLNEMGVAIN
jgi:hypothetical protein